MLIQQNLKMLIVYTRQNVMRIFLVTMLGLVRRAVWLVRESESNVCMPITHGIWPAVTIPLADGLPIESRLKYEFINTERSCGD
jgi:hypothetical protein